MAQSTPSSARSISKQAIAKTASRVAEEILKDPKKEADAHPLVIKALESVIGLRRQPAVIGHRSWGGPDFKAMVSLPLLHQEPVSCSRLD